ncbi:MAG: T9SS type A sorting domain-containing protein [Bacteroidales bacterium]|nr:T9SS type A sorting domain-containing protein [Bacteroidales bacterium]
MKKFLLMIFLAFYIMHPTNGQQNSWTSITANLPDFINDTVIINNGADTIIANISGLSFIDDNHGWICTNHPFDGEPSAVLETTDGGATWTEHDAPLAAADIYMVDENTGYLGATNGMIFKTEDGCNTWNYHGHLGAYLYDLGFPPRPAQNGYAGGKNGTMAQITPEGVFPFDLGLAGNVYCIDFPSVERGYAILDYQMIIYYMDETWHVEASYPYAGKGWLYFYNDSLGWCVGDRFLKTDTGIDWYTTSVNTVPEAPLTGVFFNDEYNGWAVGALAQIFYTNNGGSDWIRLEHTLTNGFLNGVRFTSPTNGYIYGGEKILLKYGTLIGIEETGWRVDKEREVVEVWPNPTYRQFKVQSSKRNVELERIEMVDVYGKIVEMRSQEPGTGNQEVDISHLPAGIYIIRISLDNQTIVKKIVKL